MAYKTSSLTRLPARPSVGSLIRPRTGEVQVKSLQIREMTYFNDILQITNIFGKHAEGIRLANTHCDDSGMYLVVIQVVYSDILLSSFPYRRNSGSLWISLVIIP